MQKVDCRLGAPAREHDKLCREGGGRCAHGKGRERKRRVGRKKGGQLLLSLQDQLKYPDGWLEKSGGREYEASQQKIK